mmetsp:Transcript_42123/g.88414  ORF Transcript_42123/g.88414 Transcript_42123/m.88414 type:complete len:156 (-) Transcript_42123:1250-1717(-)
MVQTNNGQATQTLFASSQHVHVQSNGILLHTSYLSRPPADTVYAHCPLSTFHNNRTTRSNKLKIISSATLRIQPIAITPPSAIIIRVARLPGSNSTNAGSHTGIGSCSWGGTGTTVSNVGVGVHNPGGTNNGNRLTISTRSSISTSSASSIPGPS